MNLDKLQSEYERAVAKIDELTAALDAAEADAVDARREAGEVLTADDVLRAMAEERAALNRAAHIRRTLARCQTERAELARRLDSERNAAVAGLIASATAEAAVGVLETYQAALAARDSIYEAQRALGSYPATSPLDAVCKGLEAALKSVGAQVIPDSNRSVMVRYGAFEHTRHQIGFVPIVTRKRQRRPLLSEIEEVVQRKNAEYQKTKAARYSEE